MIEYDIEKQNLEAGCKLTPGIESPTVSPLNNSDWVAVKSMIAKKEINDIMDKLYEIGAKGIIVSSIFSCRI
jgi:ATP phosphoribosyltransferase